MHEYTNALLVKIAQDPSSPFFWAHRHNFVSKEIDALIWVFLYNSQTVSFIPTLWKHIKADLPTCRKKQHMYIIDMYTTHIIGYTTISSVLKMLQTNGES